MSGRDTGWGRLAWLRLFAAVWRFRSLPLAARAFANVAAPCILERPFLGFSLSLDVSRSNTHRLLFLEGERHISERGLFSDLVTVSDTVVDVGANIGYYALIFRRLVGDSGRIIAFEPEPDNLVELRLNVERNRISNIEVVPVAVGARAGTVHFAGGINGRVTAHDTHVVDVVSEVRMVALDEVLTAPVDVIKIDVEGYEGEVLSGASQSIERWRPHLFLEIHPALLVGNHTVEGIFAFLQRHYTTITLYQLAHHASTTRKVMSRYFGIGTVEALPSMEAVLARCEKGEQGTFWAVCRSAERR